MKKQLMLGDKVVCSKISCGTIHAFEYEFWSVEMDGVVVEGVMVGTISAVISFPQHSSPQNPHLPERVGVPV